MSEIHYFPRYSQKENVVTNNTLLLFLRLREFSRSKFEKFIDLLCSQEDVQLASSWLKIQQQKGTGESVVDGYIAQDSVKIVIETKLYDNFDLDQIRRHFAAFSSEQHKLLLLLSPSPSQIAPGLIDSARSLAIPLNVRILHTSFEAIIENVRACLSDYDEEMGGLISDFESFCSELQLLPTDRYFLFAPACGTSFADNELLKLYYCPASYNRRTTRYLGFYTEKQVRWMGEILKVVTCEIDEGNRRVTVKSPDNVSLTSTEASRIIDASIRAREKGWDITKDHRFYLCDQMEQTTFRKTSPTGIRNFRYFDLREFIRGPLPDLPELAKRLSQQTWA